MEINDLLIDSKRMTLSQLSLDTGIRVEELIKNISPIVDKDLSPNSRIITTGVRELSLVDDNPLPSEYQFEVSLLPTKKSDDNYYIKLNNPSDKIVVAVKSRRNPPFVLAVL